MNLFKIADAKKDYVGLSEQYPDNFYFALAEKAVKRFTSANKNNKLQTSFNVMGNEVTLVVSDKELTLTINGNKFFKPQPTLPNLERIIYEIFQADLRDDVQIKRPEGRTAVNDRTEFSKAPNTVFTKLFKSVKYNEKGQKNSEVSNARNSAPAMTERQFEMSKSVGSFKPENFRKVRAGGRNYYINRDTTHVRLTNLYNGDFTNPTPQRVDNILADINKNVSWYARNESLKSILRIMEQIKPMLVTYTDVAWVIVPISNETYKLAVL